MQKNRIEVVGHLVARPELRFMPSGTKVANARLGETYRYGGRNGQQVTQTNWHSLTFYDDLADAAVSGCEKGDNLFIEGTLQQRQFTPADGSKRLVTEIIVRSFHRIASSRATGLDPVSTSAPRSTEGDGLYDPDWPVGPA